MRVEYETNNYAWNYDARMGVGNFTRKSDNAITLLDTGSDCQLLREQFVQLWDMAANNEITEERRDGVFDMYAGEFTYEL
jgi:hypothetical protein